MEEAMFISARPQCCKFIIDGLKTWDIRKRKPKLKVPFKCYQYCTVNSFDYPVDKCDRDFYMKSKGKVIGEFICDRVIEITSERLELPSGLKYVLKIDGIPADTYLSKLSKMPYDTIIGYLGNQRKGWALHISSLNVYDKPRRMEEFRKAKRSCRYGDLKYKTPEDCDKCKNSTCYLEYAPVSWCYVEEVQKND